MRALLLVPVIALLAACAARQVPVEESAVVTRPAKVSDGKPVAPAAAATALPKYHVVRRGETLYSIAFRYGLDFRVLAQRNQIREPFTIFPGQQLALREGKAVAAAPVTQPPAAPATRPPAEPRKPVAVAPAVTTPAAPVAAPPVKAPDAVRTPAGGWRWPVQGKLLSPFNPAGVGPKGIAINGNPGDPVHAARDGRVVYTGNSLVGYGQLVIIKHDDVYLSAYAHNRKLLVREGDSVRAGDTIAEMGSSGTDRTKLHFEVRRNGDPIDPLTVLPRP